MKIYIIKISNYNIYLEGFSTNVREYTISAGIYIIDMYLFVI